MTSDASPSAIPMPAVAAAVASSASAGQPSGEPGVPDAVQHAPLGRWSGPYRSAYGWHLLYVSARAAPRQEPFDKVRDRVREDDLRDAQDRANTAALRGRVASPWAPRR